MPWLEATPMEQRERFIRDQQHGLYTMTELCDRHNISRKTGYKWLDRFDAGGRTALGDRSRAPHDVSIRPGAPRKSCSGWRRDTPASSSQRSAPRAISSHAMAW
jgi:transposase-like protein